MTGDFLPLKTNFNFATSTNLPSHHNLRLSKLPVPALDTQFWHWAPSSGTGCPVPAPDYDVCITLTPVLALVPILATVPERGAAYHPCSDTDSIIWYSQIMSVISAIHSCNPFHCCGITLVKLYPFIQLHPI